MSSDRAPGDDGSEVAALVRDCLASGTTALLVHADREAISIVQHCQQKGMQVPGELSVIAYDDEVAGTLQSSAHRRAAPPHLDRLRGHGAGRGQAARRG